MCQSNIEERKPYQSFFSPKIATVKNNLFWFPLLFPLHFSPVSAGEVYVPCKLDSAYSSPFMAFTWLLLNRANPNSWEKTEQEITLHQGDIWKKKKKHIARSPRSPFLWEYQRLASSTSNNNNYWLTDFWHSFHFSPSISHFYILAFLHRIPHL